MELIKSFILDYKSHHSILFPFVFNSSLTAPIRDESLLLKVSAGNIALWLSQSLYDDIVDKQRSPEYIPMAVFLTNLGLELFDEILPNTPIAREALSRASTALYWEISHCQKESLAKALSAELLPNYGDHTVLGEKLSGYSLAPVTLLLLSGFSIGSREVEVTRTFFEKYSVARQLNDDAHDWLSDLDQGKINSVSALVLKAYPNESKKYLQKIFWREISLTVFQLIETILQEANRCIEEMNFLGNTQHLTKMLTDAKESIIKGRTERKKVLEFISALY